MEEIIITSQYLNENPNHIFVFGDNLLRCGVGGAAKLRSHKNTYGFITKKAPTNRHYDYYKPEEYVKVYNSEYNKLKDEIVNNPDKTYLISKLGSGLANKYEIYDKIIRHYIIDLNKFKNVKFLYDALLYF